MFYNRVILSRLFIFILIALLDLVLSRNTFANTENTSINNKGLNEIKKISDSLNIAKNEYSVAVKNRKVVSPEEYNETVLFMSQCEKSLEKLTLMMANFNKADFEKVRENINIIDKQIKDKAEPDLVINQIKITDDSLEKLAKVSLKEFPLNLPSINNGRKIYQQNCAVCHGVSGLGDGSAAAGLSTKPVKFYDPEFINTSSPYTFYRAIKNGISGTAMPAWDYQLNLQEKWDVIWYVRSFVQDKDNELLTTNKNILSLLNAENISDFEKLKNFSFTADKSNLEIVKLLKSNQRFANLNDEKLIPFVNHIRNEITVLNTTGKEKEVNKTEYLNQKIIEIKSLLDESKKNYQVNDSKQSIDKAIASYLAFEPLERELGAKDNNIARKLELDFNYLKGLYAKKGNEEKVEILIKEIEDNLNNSTDILTKDTNGLALFLQSMFLILREGFEAIIIIMALITFIKKSSNDFKLLKNMYYGISLGVLASIITAFILETIFQKSNFSKEFLEGITVLLAAGMLFYVSHWLISKTQADQWQKFIKTTLSSALSNKNQLAIVSVGFLSVYREGFETILFYKALYNTSANGNMISLGLLIGIIGLAILSILFYKFSVKIPIKEFFFATGLLLYYMVFSFVGKGLHELQEGNLLSITGVKFIPEVDLIGLYPTMETITAQIIVLLAWVLAIIFSLKKTMGNEIKRIN